MVGCRFLHHPEVTTSIRNIEFEGWFYCYIAFRLEDLNDSGNWIPELTGYNDPERLLIAQQTLHQLQDLLGEPELSVLLGDLTMAEYCSITGIGVYALQNWCTVYLNPYR